jgi:uncharacterized protein (DUF342 family)
METTQTETAQSEPLTLSLNDASGEVFVHYDPAGSVAPPDRVEIRGKLAERGWNRFRMDDKAIDAFITACRDAKQAVEMVIGRREDGVVELKVSDDAMSAWMTLVPAYGGEPATQNELMDLLHSKGIVYGIQHDAIKNAFAKGQCENLEIAKGEPVVEGEQTRFETLYDKENERPEEEEDLDRIKYTDYCHILLVQTGDALMRRHPPVEGTKGTNIKGHPMLPQPTPDIQFAHDLKGAELSKTDPNLLIATTGGQPSRIPKGNGVVVNPVIDLANVDLSTGSVEFDGTLRVGGDIKAGLRVKVSGDVVVNGSVEAAEIIAGGNVAIRGGVVGHPDPTPGAHSLPETTARIFCEGFVQAMFMECAHVESGKSILLERSARQCELLAREEIVVGKQDGKNGTIMGGRTQATQRIATGTLGNSSGISTHVQVGLDPYLEKQIDEKDAEFKRRCDELDRVIKLMTFLKQNPAKGAGGVAEKAEATRKQLLGIINDLTEELKVLRAKLQLAEEAQIEVNLQICYGVEVRIAQQHWQAREDSAGARIQLKNGKLLVGR